jgi:tRNA A37 threonylcarbamoyladenosine dehydratase
METQWSREEMLLGADGLARLRGAHVAVFGVGGVGSFAAEALCRAGVGAITLVDHDTVSVSNLNRQLVALHSTLGQYKADVMAARIRDIQPDCRVTAIREFYTEENKERFFSLGFDYIADCIDSVSSKLSLIQTALERGVPILSSMGTGNRLDPSKFVITDISKTSGCPLARVMRKELRDRGIRHHLVLSSTELPLKPVPPAELPAGKRSVPGSVSWVPSSAGLMIAGYIVRELLS